MRHGNVPFVSVPPYGTPILLAYSQTVSRTRIAYVNRKVAQGESMELKASTRRSHHRCGQNIFVDLDRRLGAVKRPIHDLEGVTTC